jgi:hypothetical protein
MRKLRESQIRDWTRTRCPPAFNKGMVLDKEWGPKIRNFLRKTRLWYGSDLNWGDIEDNNETHDSEGFEIGAFE